MSVILEVVYDPSKRKLRVRPQGRDGWVQFPNGLRTEGARYEVDDLKADPTGFYRVVGSIRPCTSRPVTLDSVTPHLVRAAKVVEAQSARSTYMGCKGQTPSENLRDYEEGYIADLKLDGNWGEFRFDSQCRLRVTSRSGMDATNRKGIRECVERLEASALKCRLHDTILIVENMIGTQIGVKAQEEFGFAPNIVFDVLGLQGKNICDVFLMERRRQQEEIVRKLQAHLPEGMLRNVEWWDGKFKTQYDKVVARGGEGLVLKLKNSIYRSGVDSPDWIKCKKEVESDMVLMGVTFSDAKSYVGEGLIKCIRVGMFRDGELVHVNDVGAMTVEDRRWFTKNWKANVGKLVVEIHGWERFESGALRHPAFRRIRTDKRVEECILS